MVDKLAAPCVTVLGWVACWVILAHQVLAEAADRRGASWGNKRLIGLEISPDPDPFSSRASILHFASIPELTCCRIIIWWQAGSVTSLSSANMNAGDVAPGGALPDVVQKQQGTALLSRIRSALAKPEEDDIEKKPAKAVDVEPLPYYKLYR